MRQESGGGPQTGKIEAVEPAVDSLRPTGERQVAIRKSEGTAEADIVVETQEDEPRNDTGGERRQCLPARSPHEGVEGADGDPQKERYLKP